MQSAFLRRKMPLLLVLAFLAALLSSLPQCRAAEAVPTCAGIVPMRWRREVVSITEFGAVGDGKTLNTWSFHKAIYRIQHLRKRGGTLLYIPPGVWLTGSFDLTSHMTLYLARGAVIKAAQVSTQYIGTEMNKEDLDRGLFGVI